MGITMIKIPIQITKDNEKYINDNNMSFAKTINTMLDLLREKNINNKIINDLRVKIQKGENYNELLYRLFCSNTK